ncbi:hypothetical protein DERP_001074 [Dermatophagoides pteronyssinus]|uniref:Uncharacterized protein n=1 Tax=Dermatophagoides pteronyssinus TaxID=6956 RepID=A0ABQ8JDX9_DERPT|nr:hypothetical protein DERP_001074 [Dermatophagoides pteronyssinus]
MDLFIAIKIWPSFYLLMIWSIWSFISIYETATLDSSTSATNQSTSIVNCRCGLKPWKNRDTDSEEPTRDCCQYFIQSKQGNFSDQTFICQIHNELVYKRFHSCCITLLQSAYCSQTRIKTGAPVYKGTDMFTDSLVLHSCDSDGSIEWKDKSFVTCVFAFIVKPMFCGHYYYLIMVSSNWVLHLHVISDNSNINV